MRRMETLWFALHSSCVCPCLATIQGLCIANAKKHKEYYADIAVIDGSKRETIVKDLRIFSSIKKKEHDLIRS
jgi:hypothetical protein